ncbi:hypothetical protein C0159_07965 [Moraxella catarrhalis]|nr:hypothetical protein [Moraxella catarrhalis]MPW59711.1 hypothetical protein [Moraxella catarrhalis]MPW62709.1 hypothetical protein [Moraxella catarrhalis]MPW87888.1 hypothetical protein [Moraxella catarrhalis]MPX26344.1 hypothetical protein [Moraxella catarrhalis]
MPTAGFGGGSMSRKVIGKFDYDPIVVCSTPKMINPLRLILELKFLYFFVRFGIISMDKAFNFEKAKKVHEVPALMKLRQTYHASQADDVVNFFDKDVLEQIRKAQLTNDEKERQKANSILRVLLAPA